MTTHCTPNFGDPKSSLLACQGRKEEQVDPLRWAGAPRGGHEWAAGWPWGGCQAAVGRQPARASSRRQHMLAQTVP